MVKKTAMLIMRDDEQRTVPFRGILSQHLIYIPEKMFSWANRRGRMIVIGRPAKVDGGIGILGLNKYYLWHFRYRIGCPISR